VACVCTHTRITCNIYFSFPNRTESNRESTTDGCAATCVQLHYNIAHRNQLLRAGGGTGLLPQTSRTTVVKAASTCSPLKALVSTYLAPYRSATACASAGLTCRAAGSPFCRHTDHSRCPNIVCAANTGAAQTYHDITLGATEHNWHILCLINFLVELEKRIQLS